MGDNTSMISIAGFKVTPEELERALSASLFNDIKHTAERNTDVVRQRLNGVSAPTLARKYSISTTRVYGIEAKGYRLIRTWVQKERASMGAACGESVVSSSKGKSVSKMSLV